MSRDGLLWRIVTAYYRVRLFLLLVWREIEPRSCGIPDPYRMRGRVSAKCAWSIACNLWDGPPLCIRKPEDQPDWWWHKEKP